MTLIHTPFDLSTTAAEVLTGLDLSGRRILITGGGSGLGRAAADALRAAGAEVVTPARSELDLADLESVHTYAGGLAGPLDAVIANAGIMAVPERRLSVDGWELQLATNFLGHFALITALESRLRDHARIVLVSSGAQAGAVVDLDDPHFDRRPYDPWAAYGQSKAADVLLAVAIAGRWDGIAANTMAPGRIHTKLQRHLDPATMQSLGAMDADGALIHPDGYKTPEQGAAGEVMLAVSPLLAGVTGRYFDEDNQEGVSPWTDDVVSAQQLWGLAEEVVMTRSAAR